MRAVLLTLSLLLVHISGFAIRAPRLARDVTGVDENSLSDALRVLEREKRRLDNEASFRDWEPGYYDNWSAGDDQAINNAVNDLEEDFELDSERGDVSGDIAEYLSGLLRREEEPEAEYAVTNDMDDADEDEFLPEEEEEKDSKPDSFFNSERVSVDELKDIFDDAKSPPSSLKSKKFAARKKKTPEVENSLLGDRERMTESLKADKEKNKAAKQKKSVPRSSIDLKHLSLSQIQELLTEVDKIEKQEVLDRVSSNRESPIESIKSEESEEEDSDVEPVSEEELEEVLGADGDDDDSITRNMDDSDEENDEIAEELEDSSEPLSPPAVEEISRELLSREMYEHPDGRIKRLAKRNLKKSAPASNDMHYSAEISRLLEIIGKLRLKNLLENKEIDNLADALDTATNSQAQQSLNQLPKELKSLQRAIKIEESLQGEATELSEEDEQYLHDVIAELASVGDDDEDEYTEEEDDDAYADDVTEKRSGAEELAEDSIDIDNSFPTFADRMGQWYEEPIVGGTPTSEDDSDDDDFTDNGVTDDDIEEEEEEEEANKILEDLIDHYRAEEALVSVPEDDEDEEAEEEAEVENLLPEIEAVDEEEERSPSVSYQDALASLLGEEEVDEATQREIEQVLAQFQHNVEPWQRRELENRIRNYEQCSALDSIVSDCRLADELNIPIDDEARQLCSRHEACYTCGGVLGKASGQCDAGYLAEAFQLCDGEEKCNLKADAFLRLLQYYHRYSASSNSACQHQCVVDYIYGVAL